MNKSLDYSIQDKVRTVLTSAFDEVEKANKPSSALTARCVVLIVALTVVISFITSVAVVSSYCAFMSHQVK